MLITFTFLQYKNYTQQLYEKNTNDLLYKFYVTRVIFTKLCKLKET